MQNSSQAITDKGEISISTLVKDQALIVRVSDNGYGIEKSNLAKITDPFFTTKPPGEGTGLGLSIAYSIVKEHNGNIVFESEIGQGTTVIVTIPLS